MLSAAELYFRWTVDRVESSLIQEAQDPRRMSRDVSEILWCDALLIDAVMITQKARAIVIGAGEETTRQQYSSEFGIHHASWSDLAHFALVEACQDTVREMENWREEFGA
jgi:hypothetical protein